LGPGSVSVHRVVIDEETLARTEIRLPDPDQEPESDRRGSERAVRGRTRMLPGYLTSEGDYEQKLRLNVAAAPANLVFVRGLRAVSDRLSDRLHPPPRLDRTGCRRMAEEAIQACLDNHLLERKGVYGLRTVPGAGELSAAAGAGMACLLLDLHRDRRDSVETAARLADFALKGQHPGGLFYGKYYCRNDSWLPPGTGPDRPPQIALADTAEIACHLARFAEGMRSLGRPAERYLGAAERMAQALLASREDLTDVGTTLHPDSLLSVGAGPGGQALFELLLRLLRLSGRDAYKKALSGLFRRFYAAPPAGSPAALTQGEPDGGAGDSPLSLDQALVEARNAALLAESGYRPKGLEEYRNRLLPWICLNVRPLPRGLSMVGAVAGGLGEGRLRFRGFETALALLRLQPLVPASGQNDITGLLVSQLVGFTLQQPVGTAWLAMEEADPEPIGPVDSWLLVRELEALLRLQERFPEALNPHAGSA
jgi:hypothetical protein